MYLGTCTCVMDVCKPGFMKLMYPPVRHFRTLDALFSSAFWVWFGRNTLSPSLYITLQRGPAQTKQTGRAKQTFKMDQNAHVCKLYCNTSGTRVPGTRVPMGMGHT
jgi:hypothetical protein